MNTTKEHLEDKTMSDKTKHDDGAFACASDNGYQAGCTKREYFASMAMQGMLSSINQSYGKPNVNEASMEDSLMREQDFINDVAIKAVRYSDALIKALNKKINNE